MNYEVIMKTVKKSKEFYNKFLKCLLYTSLTLLIFNVIYLQNSLIIFWINNNTRYGSNAVQDISKVNYISESEIDFKTLLIHPGDILQSDSNIFFIETTCCTKSGAMFHEVKKNGINLDVRQACAIESAAKLNSDSKILILYSCPIDEETLRSTSNEIIQMFRYTNVKIVIFKMDSYFEGTPVENLFKEGVLETSKFPLEHTSDVLRFLTLWKYGGTYFDLDVMSLRPISELGTNFVGHELEKAIGSAILNFRKTNIGLSLLTQILHYLKHNFSPDQWSHNGPNVLTKILFKLCEDVQVIEEIDRRICDGFTLYTTKVLYPIPWDKWRLFFNETGSERVLRIIRKSYTVHLWNRHISKVKVFVGSKQPYELLAKQYCPLVHTQLETNNCVTF